MSKLLFGKDWKMTKSQSTFTAGSPDIETRRYEKVGRGYKLTVSGERNGESYEWGYSAKYDGKSHRVYGRRDVDAIEAHKVNDQITIGLFKKNGKAVALYRRDVSLNGKTLTVQAAGRLTDGTAYFDSIVYKAPKK